MKEENITYKKKKVSIYDMLQIILYLILPFLFYYKRISIYICNSIKEYISDNSL